MRSSTILAATMAVGVLASPLAKRDIVYDIDIVTVYHTITVHGHPPPTQAAGPAPTESAPADVDYSEDTEVDFPEDTDAVEDSFEENTDSGDDYGSEEPQEETYTPPSEPADEPADEPAPEPAPEPEENSDYGSAPETSYGNDYKGSCLKHHNLHRANHSVPDLVWDEGLAATAEKIGRTCVYKHNTEMDGGGYGQNIAAGVSANEISVVISDLFYNGELQAFLPQIGKAQPDMSQFEVWGHLTQIVWKDTTAVGCATVDCTGSGLANTGAGASFTVCNYKGPGNFAGEYDKNVFPPLGHPTVWGEAI